MFRLNSQLAVEDAGENDKEVELEQNLGEIKRLLLVHNEVIKHINERIPDKIQIGFFQVYCKEIKSMYIRVRENLIEKTHLLIHMIIKQKQLEVHKLKNSILKKLKQVPEDVRKLAEIDNFLNNLGIPLNTINQSIESIFELQDLLDSQYYNFSEEDFISKWRLKTIGREIWDIKLVKEVDNEDKRKKFLEVLKEEQTQLKWDIEAVNSQISKLQEYSNVDNYVIQAAEVADIDKLLKKQVETTQDIQEQEVLFNLNPTDYDMPGILRTFEPFKVFWTTTRDWKENQQRWMTCEWSELNGSEVEREVAL